MSDSHFPPEITSLPDFDGPFSAHKLAASGCDVLFASYPAGTRIPPHHHDTNNVGVVTQGRLVLLQAGERRTYGVGEWYHVPAKSEHAAEFDEDSALIEFWFARE